MKLDNRTRWMIGALVVTVAVAAFIFMKASRASMSPPSGLYYYTGPMRNKKDPNIWGDAQGNRVPPPPDAIPVPPSSANNAPKDAVGPQSVND